MENNLAIIPARGGSKRIPKKNIKLFLGKPVIAYSIELARRSGIFNEIMVSTDDQEIAERAKKYGAAVPFFRSQKTSDDHAVLNDVLTEVVSSYKSIGKVYDFICMILPTAPLIQHAVLIKTFEILKLENFDSVRPVIQFSYPIQKAFRIRQHKLEMLSPDAFNWRTQDFEPSYHDAGQFYWLNKNKLLSDPNKGGFIISETEVQDIDSEEDWEMAEIKYKLLHRLT